MLIICPSCTSRYDLDAAKLGQAGRKVRCAACQTQWHVEPADEFPDAPSEQETQALLNQELSRSGAIDEEVALRPTESEPEPEPIAPPTPKPNRKRAGRKPRLPHNGAGGEGLSVRTLVAFAAAGLALVCILVWQREFAVRATPQLAILFDKLGLPVNVRGLSLTAIESGLVQDVQGRFLVVEGDVTNVSGRVAMMPPIEVSVRDAGGQTLYTWTTEPPRPSLEPSELVRFRARLAQPPEAGQSVQVRFTSQKPTGVASVH